MAVVFVAAYHMEIENLSFRVREDERNKPMLHREFCEASALPTRNMDSNNTTAIDNMELGDLYSLVGSTHRLDRPVPTDESISFLFHRSSARIAESQDEDPCSETILKNADTLLRKVVAEKVGEGLPTKIPLAQSVFFVVYLDHRYGGNNSSVIQTRRVDVDVVEVAPNYFYFQTHFAGSSGVAVLTMEVGLESRQPNHTIPLDTLGADGSCTKPVTKTLLDKVRFRHEKVARFGLRVERGTDNSANDDRQCEYSSGEGEWNFELITGNQNMTEFLLQPHFPAPDAVLEAIAAAPSKNAKLGHYRLFSCSMDRKNRDFELAKYKLASSRVCSLGDSNFRQMGPLLRQHLPKFNYTGYYLFGHKYYGNTSSENIPFSETPQCDTGYNDVMWMNQGSHCPSFSLPETQQAYEDVFPNLVKQASCVVGVDTLVPYTKRCPERYGYIQHLSRNVWRVMAKNRVGRDILQKNNAVVAALDPMALSVRDVVMRQGDCVHYPALDAFPFYKEAVKFMIAVAGRDCPLLVSS